MPIGLAKVYIHALPLVTLHDFKSSIVHFCHPFAFNVWYNTSQKHELHCGQQTCIVTLYTVSLPCLVATLPSPFYLENTIHAHDVCYHDVWKMLFRIQKICYFHFFCG